MSIFDFVALVNRYRNFLIVNKTCGEEGSLSFDIMNTLLDGFIAFYKVELRSKS